MYNYEAKVLKVIDGDTVKLEVDCGFNLKYTANFRLIGINAPELGTEGGKEAREYLQTILSGTYAPEGLIITTSKPDKYGRWLARIYVKDPDVYYINQQSVNDKMIAAGHAVEYM